MFCWVKLFTLCSIFPTAVTCWVCSPSPVLQSNSRVQQKLGVFALPYTSMFTLSYTAVTCWVCFPSPVLMVKSTVQQKLGVVALPYTSMFTLSNTAVTCWVCFPSPVLMSSSRVKKRLVVVALPYTLTFSSRCCCWCCRLWYSTKFFPNPPNWTKLNLTFIWTKTKLSEQTLPHKWCFKTDWNIAKWQKENISESESGGHLCLTEIIIINVIS